ncbi:MAG: tRNA A37 threonylcarbamoyladenosine biosynthesis protein TsaE, partial [Vicingaceae bacterium]
MKTLTSYFKETYQLNDEQSAAISSLEDFLNSSKTCFLLKGYAGTGKTFLMKGLTEYFKEQSRNFELAAPTGRAAKVIGERTKSAACTIHKMVYSSEDIQEYKTKGLDGSETFKFFYGLRNNEDTTNTIYIIDETSMLSDVYSEAEFFRFGSGYLLSDLLKYVNFDNNQYTKKLIFIGDNAQLAPYNMKFSPGLNEDYLINKFSLNISSFELTKVVRTESDNQILTIATSLRDSLKDNIFDTIKFPISNEEVNHVGGEELLQEYLSATNAKIDDDTIIIAHSNASVKEYNDFVREQFFPESPDKIGIEDRLVVVNNNYNHQIEIMNGDFGVVQEVSSTNEKRTVVLKKKLPDGQIKNTEVLLAFRNVVITFQNEQLGSVDLPCKIYEPLLYNDKGNLTSDESKALYVDFRTRHPNLKAGTKPFKDALRTDSCFNSLRVKFGYAITCHKSQGGEWKRAFVDCKTAMGYHNSNYYRWLYTAITRAKETLYTLNTPNFSFTSSLQASSIENTTIQSDVLILDQSLLEVDLHLEFANELQRNFALVVFDKIKDLGIHITQVEHKQYQEIYHITQDKESIRISLHYKKEGTISIIKSVSQSELVAKIEGVLKELEGKKVIVLKEDDTTDIEEQFEFEHAFQEEFYNRINEKSSLRGVRITKIEHKEYHEYYEFSKGG